METYVNSMQHHVLIHMISTYFNIPVVEKIAYTTWKRATNQTLIPKRNLISNHLVAAKKPPSHKEQNRSKAAISPTTDLLAEPKGNQ